MFTQIDSFVITTWTLLSFDSTLLLCAVNLLDYEAPCFMHNVEPCVPY